jgi:phage internal scaffolding protein
MTKQSDKDSCDINLILDRYAKTGVLPDLITKDPQYGDFTDVPTYQEACSIVSLAEAQFEALDAKTRERFGNDPALMLDFCSKSENHDEMVKLGLAIAKPANQGTNTAPDLSGIAGKESIPASKT